MSDTNALGERGEDIVKKLLTDFLDLPEPLFRVQIFNAKWPTLDLYVEVTGAHRVRPFLLVQVKTTQSSPLPGADLAVSVSGDDVARLRRIPGPVYIAAVDEPNERVYLRAVCNIPGAAVGSIPAANILTRQRLSDLRDEVLQFWQTYPTSMNISVF